MLLIARSSIVINMINLRYDETARHIAPLTQPPHNTQTANWIKSRWLFYPLHPRRLNPANNSTFANICRRFLLGVTCSTTKITCSSSTTTTNHLSGRRFGKVAPNLNCLVTLWLLNCQCRWSGETLARPTTLACEQRNHTRRAPSDTQSECDHRGIIVELCFIHSYNYLIIAILETEARAGVRKWIGATKHEMTTDIAKICYWRAHHLAKLTAKVLAQVT